MGSQPCPTSIFNCGIFKWRDFEPRVMIDWGCLFRGVWRLEGDWECTIEDAVERAAETHTVGEMMFDACSKLAAAERAYEDETNRDDVKLEKVVFWRSFPDIIMKVTKRRLEDDAKLGEELAMGPEGEGWWRGVDRSA